MSRKLRLDGTFDIECAGWDRFVVGALFSPIDGPAFVRSPDELVDALLDRGGTWWSWCGGQYDMVQVADVLYRRGVSVRCDTAAGRVSRITVKGLELRDAWNLIPMDLDAAAGIAGLPPVGPPGLPCHCGTSCGGYCSISTRMPPAALRQLEAYCAADARMAYEAIAALMRHAAAEGYSLKGTIGGTAWSTAQAWLGLPSSDLPSWLWKRIKYTDYPGRVIIARPAAQRVDHWDMSGAYPAALAQTPLPDGEPLHVVGRRALIALKNRRPGFYAVRLRVPETYLPPLPWRCNGRVAYPHGRILGYWALPELEAAVERGCQIEGIAEAICYPDERIVFAEAIDRWHQVRLRHGKDSAIGAWQRLLMNSLTGKLGQGPWGEDVAFYPDQSARKYCTDAERPRPRGCTVARCLCGAWRDLDRWGYIVARPFFRPAESGHVAWSSYCKAVTRVRELAGLESAADDLVMGDTDSVWRRKPELSFEGNQAYLAPGPQGSGLGSWEHKGDYTDFLAFAVQRYRYRDQTGQVVRRWAGLSGLTDEQWARLEARQQVQLEGRGVLSLRQAARISEPGGKLFRRRGTAYALGDPDGYYGDRLLSTDGRTYPLSCDQAKDRFARKPRS